MTKRRSRVCHILNEFHPVFSGRGEYTKKLVRELSKLGYRFIVITRQTDDVPKRGRFEDIAITRIPDHKNYYRHMLSLMAALIKLRGHYDIIHLNGLVDRLGVLPILAKVLKKKIVMQMVLMGADDPMTFQKVYKCARMRLRLLSLMDRFVAISEALCNKCREARLPEKKLAHIPNGVDLSRFHPVPDDEKAKIRDELGISAAGRIVVFVGTIMYRKGVDTLLDAWEKVQSACNDVQLVLVGLDEFDDSHAHAKELRLYVQNIKKRVETEKLNVQFTGLTDKVDKYLKISSAFAFPSRAEGFGNVIVESMAHGLPCVVTPMDGVARETIEEGVNGFVVDSAEQMAERIIQLLQDEDLSRKMGAAGQRIAREKFDIRKIAQRYDDLYRSL